MHVKNKTSRADLGSLLLIFKDLKFIISFFDTKRKTQLFFLLILQVISGFSEILSLGAILPFISAITNADAFIERAEIQPIIQLLNIQSEKELIYATTIAFITAFICVNAIKLFTFWVQTKISAVMGNDLSKIFFSKILHQNFEYSLNNNSSMMISRITSDLNGVLQFIGYSMLISTQTFSIAAIFTAIVYYNPIAALIIISSTTVLYLIVARLNRKQLLQNGRVRSNANAALLYSLHVSLGGIRDVIMGGKHSEFIGRFSEADARFRSASARTSFLTVLPRYFIEVVGIVALASIAAFYAVSADGVLDALPLIGALALVTIRVLPAAQSVYHAFAGMQGVHVSVERVLKILDLPAQEIQESKNGELLVPQRSVDLQGIWFRFQGNNETSESSDWILKGVNLSIPINKTVALVGKTGGGKTTISDVVAGLLYPEKGVLCVDGLEISLGQIASWRGHVACVPQAIFLLDASVMENVAFGEASKDIDIARVREACRLAQIDKLIESRPDQYDEIIGENGLKLSGGQRQRIGLARALYQNSSLIILDEATSALDNKTEKAVMQTISSIQGSRTILIIAHRLDTIKKADLIYEVQDGEIVAQGSFEELIEKSSSFRDIALTSDH